MSVTFYTGDCRHVLQSMPEASVNCCVTSPPYWGLRDYGHDRQIGLEQTPEDYVKHLVEVFARVWRVLRSDGTLWVNLGDSYVGSPNGGQCDFSSSGLKRDGRAEDSRLRTLANSKEVSRRQPAAGRDTGFLKPKNLVGIPWRVAFALQTSGWYLRSDIIWHKPNPMPESVTDRPTKAHEYLFLLSKSERYHYDVEAIKEPAIAGDNGSSFLSEYDIITKENLGQKPRKKLLSWDERKALGEGPRRGISQNGCSAIGNDSGLRNKRSVWTVPTSPYAEAHFATYPPDLIKPCILAGCPVGGTVLDPFGGSGTTGMVALELGRKAILIELNPEYVKLAEQRCNVTPGLALI
jgi:DNA modification methylase